MDYVLDLSDDDRYLLMYGVFVIVFGNEIGDSNSKAVYSVSDRKFHQRLR